MNCLITRLKGVIDDDSFYKLGELRLSKSQADEFTQIGQSFRIAFVKNATVSIIGDGYFTDTTGSQNKGKIVNCLANTPYNLFISNGDYEISFSDKYSIGNFTFKQADETTGTYLYNNTKNIIGDLSSLKYSNNMSSLDLGLVFNIKGELSILGNLKSLTNLNISQTKISGNIKVLKCPLIYLNIDRCNNNVTGSIEDFVNTQRTSGRTTGSCSLVVGSDNPAVTFNGAKLEKETNSLNWTETQITCGDTTITA